MFCTAMPFHREIIGARYNLRVEDLTAADILVVACAGCGRVYRVAPAELRARFQPYERIKTVGERFRCRSCGGRGCEWHTERAVAPPL